MNAARECVGRSQAKPKGKKKQRQGRVIWFEERGKREEVERAERKKEAQRAGERERETDRGRERERKSRANKREEK